MSADSTQRSEDQFLCSICLDVFTDPVSTPCGHNFCRTCISEHWDVYDRHDCPICKQVFYPTPQLQVNTLIAELADEFRQSAGDAVPQQQAAKPQDVPPDVSTGASRKSWIFQLMGACIFIAFAYVMQQLILRMVAEEMKKEFPKLQARAELQKVQRYAVEVTLDPDTAHPLLVLSDDGKRVNLGKAWKYLPDNPERFYYGYAALGKQRFSSGRFYFEVQVKGKTQWEVGVAKESINRKGDITLMPQHGYWTIWLRDGKYKAFAGPAVDLSLQSPPEKVGVFVDYDEGLVSFYDVDSAALIHSFTGCSFTEKLYPFFGPGINDSGKNFAPLIITSVKH